MHNDNIEILSDEEIIELYWLRDELAISETDKKYRRYLYTVAFDILRNQQDCEECIDDTYMGVWNSIPPNKPKIFKSFLTVILRRSAINIYNHKNKKSRVPSSLTVSLSDIEPYVCSADTIDSQINSELLGKIISDYLRGLSQRQRYIFMARYYVGEPIDKIAKELNLSRSGLNKELSRIKDGLRKALESEDFYI